MSVYQNVYYCDENQTNYFFQINGFNTEQLNYIIKDKIQKQNKFENRPKMITTQYVNLTFIWRYK